MAEAVHHPIFARVFARLVGVEETKGGADHRAELLAGLRGRVVEIGAGTGANFKHYPDSVTEIVAVEPEPYLRARAREAVPDVSVRVTILDGIADRLPLERAGFDAAVTSLVLCSVPDQASALAEIRRVLRPDGELRFYEHVRASTPGLARFQATIDRVWPFFGGGCHTSRTTLSSISDAGFEVTRVREFDFRPSIFSAPVAPHILGRAVLASGG